MALSLRSIPVRSLFWASSCSNSCDFMLIVTLFMLCSDEPGREEVYGVMVLIDENELIRPIASCFCLYNSLHAADSKLCSSVSISTCTDSCSLITLSNWTCCSTSEEPWLRGIGTSGKSEDLSLGMSLS